MWDQLRQHPSIALSFIFPCHISFYSLKTYAKEVLTGSLSDVFRDTLQRHPEPLSRLMTVLDHFSSDHG